MKGYFLFFTFFLCGLSLSGQFENRADSSFYNIQGYHHFGIGIGLVNQQNFFYNVFDINGSADPSSALNLAYEYSIFDQLNIGVGLNYYRVTAEETINLDIADFQNIFEDLLSDPLCFSECVLGIPLGASCACQVAGKVKERVNVYTLGGRLSYHFNRIPNVDTYTSFYLGYSFNKRKTTIESSLDAISDQLGIETDVPPVIYYAHAGARLYLMENLSIYGEYGYGNSHLLNLGVMYRL